MNLDIRSMMVMVLPLNLLCFLLLTLAGFQAGNVHGVRHWAIGSLFTGLALSSAYTVTDPVYSSGVVISGSTLLAAALGFQFNGIQYFKTGRYNRCIPLFLVCLIFVIDYWFVFLSPNVHARVISNSLIFGLCNLANARALLIPIAQPLRTAYWFTGGSFLLFAIVLISRAIIVYLAPPHSFFLYSTTPINPTTFFIGSLVQMSVTFGFVLMLNYQLATELQKLALTDALTGALNRRSIEQEAFRLTARCKRTGDTLAVMMIDVDHFKSINDRYGHAIGDEVLKRLAKVAQKTIRTDDYFARYGGEEFCVLLPSTAEKEAWIMADRLRQLFSAEEMESNGEVLKSTISIGVADSAQLGVDLVPLIAAADQAMYRAKQAGRNRVVMYSQRMGQIESSSTH